LNWVPQLSTRAAQKMPEDAEQQIYELFLQLALFFYDSGIHHPHLLINFDQTQVVMADNSAKTFDGSCQVDILDKEEKRAFTAVVGVSALGSILLTQFVFKGATERSLPSPKAPHHDEASHLGFLYCCWNPDTYWSDLNAMRQYFNVIVIPYFAEQKCLLGYPDDQECAVLLNCWSVHRGQAFHDMVCKDWLWIRLFYVLGGTT
ncbi:hypothetical protein CONPUDRAFT_28077, partial [Coniophora puteana RWD-64-598 SS2]